MCAKPSVQLAASLMTGSRPPSDGLEHRRDHAVGHHVAPAGVALRGPRGAAAERLDAVGHDHAHARAVEQPREGLRRADAVARRSEHAVDARGQVDRDRLFVAGADGAGAGAAGEPAARQFRRVLRHDVGTQHRAPDGGRGLHEADGHVIGGREGDGAGAGHRAPRLRRGLPAGGEHRILLFAPQALDEVARVDQHGARRDAHAVDGARLHAVVVVVLLEFAGERLVAVRSRALDAAAHHDALARREGQVLRRAGRLAVAALDAAIGLDLDRLRVLEVLQVRVGILVDEHARIEDAARIAQALERAHHVVELVAVLTTDVGRHDPARAVLGLEVAARLRGRGRPSPR